MATLPLGKIWLTVLAHLAGLAVGLGVLTWLMPCNPGMYWWKKLRAFATDLVYWLLVPLFTRLASLAFLVLGVSWIYRGAEPHFLPVGSLPLWAQCGLILLLQDVLLYWLHRAFHGRWVWKFHAVHHSPRVLDWPSTSRFHPVNQVFSFCLTDAAVLLLGFSQEALAGLATFNVVYSAFVHANLNWTFGPFRYVLASPVFHRWHHTSEKEGLDKNFASTFPVLDLIFGTFYLPEGKLPQNFGIGDPEMPESFVGQLAYPFRQNRSLASRGVPIALGLCCLGLGGLGGLTMLIVSRQPQAAADQVAGASQQEDPTALETDPRFTLQTRTPVLAAAISADGRFVASAGTDGSVKRWELAARQTLTFMGHARSVRSVAISADGGRLASGGYDRTVRLWDASTQKQLASRPEAMGVLGVAISADGETIATGGADGVVRVWKPASDSSTVLTQAGESVPSVAISPDGRRVAGACVDGVVRTWDVRTGKREHALRGPASLALCVALSADGRLVAAGSHDGMIYVWDGETGEQLFAVGGHNGSVMGVAITPDGGRVVSGGVDGVVRVWDGRTGREVVTFTRHFAGVNGVAVSADGNWAVSGSSDGTLLVWKLPTTPRSKSAGAEEAASE